MNMWRRVLFVALTLSCVRSGLAQDGSDSAKQDLMGDPSFLYPAAINNWEIEGGYNANLREGQNDDYFYRIAYKGSMLSEEGTPFKSAQGLEFLMPKLESAAGDIRQLSFRYENGTTTTGGSLFDALGAVPLNLRGLDKLNLRGTAFIAGNLDDRNFQMAVGLESPPLRLPFVSGHGFSNWLVLGVGGQHQEDADSADLDKSYGLATFRAFVGKAFGWRKSADVGSTQAMIKERVLAQAPTYASALALAERIEVATEGRLRTKVQQFLLDAVVEAEPGPDMSAEQRNRNWRDVVSAMALGEADAITDQPTLSVYAEWSGWYSFEDEPDGDRYKDLFTATLDYWPLESYDNALLRLRYEHGYERAAPQLKKNQVLAAVVLRF